jgi:predicted RNA binding protein YcfA (HicA-like mRNA interferase family)
MKVPRDLSGRTLADHLIRRWQYREAHQTGSHILLRTEQPSGQTLPIPAHKPLRLGTLAAILRMVAEHKGVTRDDVLRDL